MLKRLQAEYENFQKRTLREKEQYSSVVCAGVIERLLPVLDTLDQAIKDSESKGMSLVREQLLSILSSYGLRPIEAIGKPFDPNYHEVMLKVESDQAEDTVLEEIQRGYMLGDRVLRHSKVKLSKNAKQAEQGKGD